MSSLVMGLSLLIVGVNLQNSLVSSPWLAFSCILTYMLAAPIGLCSIPFMYIVELYPEEARSVLGAVTIALSNAEMFLVVKTYPLLQELLKDHGVYYFYATPCLFATIFVRFVIPETKDIVLI